MQKAGLLPGKGKEDAGGKGKRLIAEGGRWLLSLNGFQGIQEAVERRHAGGAVGREGGSRALEEGTYTEAPHQPVSV